MPTLPRWCWLQPVGHTSRVDRCQGRVDPLGASLIYGSSAPRFSSAIWMRISTPLLVLLLIASTF